MRLAFAYRYHHGNSPRIIIVPLFSEETFDIVIILILPGTTGFVPDETWHRDIEGRGRALDMALIER
jgi:hypothetical protein